VLELCSRAQAAETAISSNDDFSAKEKEAFVQIKIIHKILQCSSCGDVSGVLQHLWELPFIPSERYRLQASVMAIKSSHSAVAERLQSILLAAGEALSKVGKQEELHILLSLAAALPDKISQQAYQKLNEYQSMLA